MVKLTFKHPKFIKTAVAAKDYPTLRNASGHILPEVAVVGRSNVGKSSLLNHLFQVKNLVKTSSTPGKTQALNFFTLNDELTFVDLPGYGYAKVGLTIRKKWGPMIQAYLEKREPLKLILFLFDIRRVPGEEDARLLEWAAHYQKAVILVLTKVDKVTLNEKNHHTKQILRAFNCENLHHVHYSTTQNIGRKELIGLIVDAFKDEES
jgi:GTP-binding protein